MDLGRNLTFGQQRYRYYISRHWPTMSLHNLFKNSVRFSSSSSLVSKFLSRCNTKPSKPISLPSTPCHISQEEPCATQNSEKYYRNHTDRWVDKYKNKYKNADQFIVKRFGDKIFAHHTIPNTLPRSPTDIRGIDAALYNSPGNKFWKLPTLAESKQLSIRYIPSWHKLAGPRKSNVAYAFTYSRGHRLNSPNLEKDLNKYNGPLRHKMIFQAKSHPFAGSVTRSRTRKLAKRSLFQAIHQETGEKGASDVSGIFFFSFMQPPASIRDQTAYKKLINDAIKRLLTDKSFQLKLRAAVLKQNASFSKNNTVPSFKKELLINAEKTLGYYPRLPFL